ncbi:mitogen-activated protein kinase kinase kinase 20-like [Cannabis sativa]|uniref:mitogen-activated protein kinase kinase kinase 20-like n=1 Tax=Cannabis sativa TaxID=3483 RepID=UPI0029C9F25A|nr:mitogen-activated protein kinase kinase kinase 20-like [Cannabis sativa]
MAKYNGVELEKSVHSLPFWARGQILGEGGFGCVYFARMMTLPTPIDGISHVRSFHPLMAVKTAFPSKSKELEDEKKILDNFVDCPYIIECYGDDTTINIIDGNKKVLYNVFLEYAHGGTLFEFVKTSPPYDESKQVKEYIRQILKGVNYIHEKGFIHSDLNPENILLVKEREEDTFFVAKISDFGLAKMVDDFKTLTPIVGTLEYLAPECLGKNGIQGQFSDIWAIGITILFMLTKNVKWSNDLSHHISEEAKDFIMKCIQANPFKRPSAKMLLSHSFLANT